MRKYLLKPDRPDERDYVYRPELHPHQLPSEVDLVNEYMPPVVDQGELGSCTANALASGLREYWLRKDKGDDTRLSRLYLYWHERALEGTVDQDSGAYLRDGMKVLKKLGCCPEEDFPYDITRFTEQPSEKAEADAGKYRISEYHRVRSFRALQDALAKGYPVALGIIVFESFESEEVARTGIVPMPRAYDRELGGHAILAVGYDDNKGYVKFRNSWGENWGDGGYGYLPYEYFFEHYVMDMWTGR